MNNHREHQTRSSPALVMMTLCTLLLIGVSLGDEGHMVASVAAMGSTIHGQPLPPTARSHSFSPPFVTAYKLDYSESAFAIQQTEDGGYIVAGDAQVPDQDPFQYQKGTWVLKLDSGGSVVWQKVYSHTHWERAWDIEQTEDGGYIVAAETDSPGYGDDAWLLKLDADGRVGWQKTYGHIYNDNIYDIEQAEDGGYIMAGSSALGLAGRDAWVVKLDANGNITWQEILTGTFEIRSIQQTDEGGYIAAGGAGWVLKLNPDGSVAWQKSCGAAQVVAYDVQQTDDGGYVVAGWEKSVGAGGDDAWVLKLNAGGDIVWQKTYGGADDEWGIAIELTDDGGYAVAATINYLEAETSDAWVIKLNADGSISWQKRYGGMDWDQICDIEATSDGGYVMTGMTQSFEANGIWVLKMDAEGSFCAECSLAKNTSIVPVGSSATVADSSAVLVNSNVTVRDVVATVYDTNAIPEPICICAPSANNDLWLYGTFEAMGVVVTLDAADDPDLDVVAEVAYRPAGQGAYLPGLPLARVSETRLAGSLFWLEPGTDYQVRVTFHDPDGGPLDGTTIAGDGSTYAEIAVPTPSRSYYVSPNGSGTACSLADPCSLAEGLAQAWAGDEVVLRGGVYYQGEINLPHPGAAGTPLVIRGYQGETAVLDGGDPAILPWTAQGGGVYHATANEPNPHLVTADGQRLLRYQSLSDLQNLIWAVPGFYADGTDLHVRLAGDADPNGAAMVVSRYNYGFTVELDHVYFLDLTFRHYGQGSYAKAIYFNNASGNLVQGCTFALNDLGIGLKRDSHRNVIQDNEFYDTLFDWPWDAFYTGISLSSGGIRFYSPATGRGNVIRRNTFHDYFDGLGVCPEEAGSGTNETDVYDNLVYRAGDDGLETDGTCSNVRLWGNTFHDVLVGISLAPVYDGPVYALRNVVYRTGVGNNDYPGSPFKFNSGYPHSGPIYLFHNTADAVLPGNNGLDIKSPGTWDLIYARNNVWSGTEYALSNANPDQPLDLDYDALYTTMPGELAWWAELPDRHLNTLTELQAATGQELHGLNVEPGFVDAPGGDYRPAADSALIDAGVAIPGINPDYHGGAPDIGAHELGDYRGVYLPLVLRMD